MKAIAIGLLAAASIALSAPANAHIWVGAGATPGWGGYWHYDRGYLGPTANNYWRYYRIPARWHATAPAGGGSPAACKSFAR